MVAIQCTVILWQPTTNHALITLHLSTIGDLKEKSSFHWKNAINNYQLLISWFQVKKLQKNGDYHNLQRVSFLILIYIRAVIWLAIKYSHWNLSKCSKIITWLNMSREYLSMLSCGLTIMCMYTSVLKKIILIFNYWLSSLSPLGEWGHERVFSILICIWFSTLTAEEHLKNPLEYEMIIFI